MGCNIGQTALLALTNDNVKKVLLLDEPFAGLDKDSREVLWQNLVAHQQYGILIIVTHHVWHMTQSVNVLRLPEPSL